MYYMNAMYKLCILYYVLLYMPCRMAILTYPSVLRKKSVPSDWRLLEEAQIESSRSRLQSLRSYLDTTSTSNTTTSSSANQPVAATGASANFSALLEGARLFLDDCRSLHPVRSSYCYYLCTALGSAFVLALGIALASAGQQP
jgi:hypothetical protein